MDDALDGTDDPGMDIRERIYHYRMAGETIDTISRLMNLSRMRVATLYREFVVEMAKIGRDDTEQARDLELDRLDRLHSVYWKAATEPHEAYVEVGKGRDAHMEKVSMDPDINAAKMVLEISKHRAKLTGMEQLSATDPNTVTNILVMGNSTSAFLEALEMGRRPALTSGDQDNDIEGESVTEGMGAA